MSSNINHEHIWGDINAMLDQMNIDSIFRGHLEKCGHKIMGYWHEDEYYEEVSFIDSIRGELASASLGITESEQRRQNWLQLKFLISSNSATLGDRSISDHETRIGELTLIFNSHMEFLDEKWLLNINSPFVTAKKGVRP